jgi:hypothetical protein
MKDVWLGAVSAGFRAVRWSIPIQEDNNRIQRPYLGAPYGVRIQGPPYFHFYRKTMPISRVQVLGGQKGKLLLVLYSIFIRDSESRVILDHILLSHDSGNRAGAKSVPTALSMYEGWAKIFGPCTATFNDLLCFINIPK